MLKKFLFLAVFSLLFGKFPVPQTQALVTFDPLPKLRAVIEAEDIVGVGKNIILDASKSTLLNTTEPVEYTWDFGDGSGKEIEEETVHAYQKPGEYRVTLSIKQGKESASVARDVFVYSRLSLLITDITEKAENISNLAIAARSDGTQISIISSYDNISAYVTEEILTKKLADNIAIIRDADPIIIWTERGSGINALTRFIRENSFDATLLKTKSIVTITDENIKTVARTLQSHFKIIQPRQIVLTRQYELNSLVSAQTVDEFIVSLKSGVSEYFIVNEETGKVSLLNFISTLVNFMIAQGIPSHTLILLLMLPLIATIVTIMKQVVGMTTFGVYTPSIITLSFLALGLKFGLIILVVVVITGAILRIVLDRFRLLYIPRISIILTITSLILLLVLALGTRLGVGQLASIAVFPMLIMTTLAEKFVSAQSGKGFMPAILLVAETTFVSLICYWVVQWKLIQTLFLGYPELIFILLIVNIFLGRFTGLRVLEYVRFREIMKHVEE